MNSQEFFTPQNQNIKDENYTNIKILLSLSFVIIFSYIIEKILRLTFIKTFYLLIILVIIAAFIFLNLSTNSPQFKQLKYYLSYNFNSNPKISKEKFNKERLEKVKNIYESGYLLNKRNNNNIEQNQMFNPNVSNLNNSNYNNMFNNSRNDDILANKISNINKINNEPLINSFNKNFTNGYNNESKINFESNNNEFNNIHFLNNNNNNEFSGEKNYTNLPSSELRNSNYSQKSFNFSQINNNDGNFKLLSTNNNQNKYSEQSFISNFQYTNPINKLSINSEYENNIYGKQIKIIPKNKENSFTKYQYLKSRYSNTQELNQNNNQLKYSIDKIPRELVNINYKSWIIRMKYFISRNLIPNIVAKHDENLSNINLILAPLGLKLISTLPENEENDFLKVFKERIYFINTNKIDINFDFNKNKLNNILYKKAKNFCNDNLLFMNKDNNFDEFNNNKFSNISMFPSLINFNDYLSEKNEKDKFNPENKLKKIFFGDTIKINLIIKDKK